MDGNPCSAVCSEAAVSGARATNRTRPRSDRQGADWMHFNVAHFCALPSVKLRSDHMGGPPAAAASLLIKVKAGAKLAASATLARAPTRLRSTTFLSFRFGFIFFGSFCFFTPHKMRVAESSSRWRLRSTLSCLSRRTFRSCRRAPNLPSDA
jgi:hypothetical protein